MEISGWTYGYFDPTVDPILNAWSYFKKPILPDKNVLDSLLDYVDYRMVEIRDDRIFMPRGFSLTIGGSAKGYILDRTSKIIRKMQIKSAIIDAGGDIVLIGKKMNKEKWTVGIRHPRIKNGILGKLNASDCYIATSGDYERYFIKDNIRYHHIINPHNGYPANEVQSVTVIGKNGILVDCLSTSLLAMGIERAIDFVKENKIEALIVDSSGKKYNYINKTEIEIYE